MSLDTYGLHVGPLYFRFYGVILMLGAFVAAVLGARMLKAEKRDTELAWDALFWILIFGLIGARLYHILTPSLSLREQGITTLWYLTHPLDMINTTQGGLGMPGAIAGGVLGLYIFARRRKLNFGYLIDITAPLVALAQGIGRWGNFVNQELYGPPSDLPWAVFIRPENRLVGYQAFERFHPLFLYESIWNLANAGFLYWMWKNKREDLRPGDIFLIYMVTYPLGRFLLEFIRLDFVPYFGINFNQALMLLVAIASGVVLYLRQRNKPVPARRRH